MNGVLYTHELEPITVIDLPMGLWDMLARGQSVQVAVMDPVEFVPWTEHDPLTSFVRTVRITGDVLRRGRHQTMMLFTHDEVDALLLQAAFLPGQNGEVQAMQRRAFIEGLLSYR